MKIAFLAPIASSFILACSGTTASVGASDGGTDGAADAPTVTGDQAATDAATAVCNRFAACAPLYVGALGDEATCVARFKKQLLIELAATNTSSTPAQLESCATAVHAATCADVLSRNFPSVCHATPGPLANGAACSQDGQCSGTRCKVAKNEVCGTCTAPAAEGGPCGVDDDCAPAMACAGGACAKYGAEMAACDANKPCRPDLACVGGACVARKPAGSACTSGTGDVCDELHGVVCNPTTSTCAPVSFVASGTCGLVAGGLVLCSGAGATCKGIMPPNYQGTCIAGAADGAACDETNGPACMPPAVCSGGTCQLADPSSCH